MLVSYCSNKDAIEAIYPPSHLQLGLLFHSSLEPKSTAYLTTVVRQFSGFFDRDSFEASWRYIIERHEALRACFIWKEVEEPVQVILQEVALPIDWHDWRHLSKSEQDKRFFELVDEDRSRGLDPASAPLLRLTLVQMDDEEYRVILTMHHLIVDGWSLPIVFREFIECYRAFSSGQEPRLEPVRPYEDYITWLNQQDQQASEAYWRSALSGLLEPTRLGVGNSAKPTDQSVRQVIHSHRLTRTLTQALQDFARRNRVTLNTVFQAAWALLLSRHSETNDIVFGATTSGRPPELRGVEDIVGMFINTLPVRVRINPDCALVDWLHQLQIEQTERLEHQYSPLVDIHNWSDIPQSSPLFEVLYVFENFPTGSKTKNTTTKLEKTVSIENIHSISHSNYPLCLRVTPQRKALLDILFDPKYIPSSVAERLVVHLERLLAAMASADPEQKISTLSLLDEAERHQVLEEWNATAADYPQDRCLHELIAEQVARQPDAVAVEFEGQCLSYGELEARANQLAHHLRTLGVGPEVIVGLCVDRSAEMVVSLLAILKAGGAYLPLDPAYPPDRLAFMLQDAGASLVVCDDAHSGLVSDHPLVCLQADAEIIRQYPQSSPDVTVDAENLAYVTYTSGSTGHPKGVLSLHRGAGNYLEHFSHQWNISDTDRTIQIPSIVFDASIRNILGVLISGGYVFIPPRTNVNDPRIIANLIHTKEITVLMSATPSFMGELCSHLESFKTPTRSIRAVFISGEILTWPLLNRIRRLSSNSMTVNLYGPTECTMTTTYFEVPSDTSIDEQKSSSVPIGYPIWNTQLYVLDGGLEPVPVGVSGELYIGGVGLARGYLGRPDLTAERFVPDPFGSAGGRLYRTGDRVCRRADGALEFLGRYDHQVKLRGYRIETGEIEAALTSHPSVGQAAVLLRADGPGEGRLVAYVVGDASAGDLRAHLQQTLPDYMVPAAFVTLSALPLTPNGKLDRKALPEPDDSGLVRKAYIAPRTPVEEMLTSIWAEVLGVTQVGVEDNFFDLGGHSLLAMQVMARVGQAFAVEIPLKALFEAPCVKDLAAAVELALGLGRTMEDLPLDPVDRSGALKLSHSQERLWFLDQLAPEQSAYNVSGAVRLNGALDVPSLERAFAALIERHESLRTRIVEEEGVGYQVIDPPADFLLKITDVDGLSSEQLKAHMQDLTAARFDLSTGPLFRAELLRLAADRHVLVVSIHHIVSDAWSIGVLVRELGELYAAQCEERPADLPTLPVQYADYAAWQRRWLEGERLEGQLSYWCDKLQELPTLDLPTDHPRPAVMSGHGARIEVTFPAELSGALTALSQREGVTLFMVLLAAFQVLLSRHSEQNDVVVGAPVAGRRRPELEGLIGFFVNTLVLRGNLSDDPSVHDLLVRTRELALEAYGHQDVPFERLVEALQPQRDLSRHPLFQAMLVLQNAPGDAMALPGLSVQSEPLTGNTAKFDLTLSLSETREGLRGRLEYSTDLFEASTMERLVVHLERLLAAMASADPEQKISTLSLLDETERHQVLEEWNATAADYPQDRCLHELIAEQVARQPDAVAVEFEGQCLSYGELEARANQLAHHLRTLGVGPEVIVGLCVDRSAEMVVSLLAILKAGGAYLPLDPAYPPDRLAFMLQDAGASLVVCDDAHSGLVSDHPLVCLQADAEIIRQYPQSSPDVTVDAENLAYVIYTSGSTGRPKGVMIRHQNLKSYLLWAAHTYGASDWTKSLVHSPIFFDLSVTSLWLPLLLGRCCELVPEEPDALKFTLQRIPDSKSFIKLTPSHLRMLEGEIPTDAIDTTNLLVIGGEALSSDGFGPWSKKHTTEIVNEYGPSEATVGCCVQTVSIPSDTSIGEQKSSSVPIGYPIWNTQLYVLDGGLDPVPVGVSGELYIGGVGLARGYLGRPDLTAERFVPDPFGSAGGRLYRTGDRVYRRADGALEFLGRYDHQVKLRGYRIETGEIEAALTSHPSVGQAAVLLRADGPGEGRLVAYVVGDASAGDLRAHLQQTLPDYMVPAAFVTLSALPLTPNGKLDRKALPEPDDSGLVRKAYIAPRTPVEEMLTSIWAEVLGVTQVGVEDNFFDLGGHSLLAMQVMARVGQAFAVEIPLKALFEAPCVKDLAAAVELALGLGRTMEDLPLDPVDRSGALKLSHSQERLWFLDQLAPEQSAYNVSGAVRLNGALDVPSLERAFTALIERHESLRTRIVEEEGVGYQVIDPPADFLLKITDVDGLSSEQLKAHMQDLTAARFDLSTGPLFRAELLRLAADRHVLVVSIHHIVSDAWSIGVLVRELGELYAAQCEERPADLPTLPVQYADYAAWQRRWLEGERLEGQLSYWCDKLQELPTLDLPTDHPRPAVMSGHGARIEVTFPAELSGALTALSQREGVTLFMVLLAAFQVLLSRHSEQNDVVVGAPVAGRRRPELEGLIGFFVNTLVLRGNLSDDPSVHDLLVRTRELALEAYGHQDVPFERLVEALQPQRDLSRHPLFQAMLVLQNAPGDAMALPGLSVQSEPLTGNTAKFDLTLSLSETREGLRGRLEYSTDLFEASTMERLVVHLERLLAAMASADPEQKISTLSLLDEAERHQVLEEWNATAADYPQDRCLHELIAEQAARQPDAVAVEFEGQCLSYGELEARANQLAHHLRTLGVGPEVIVGLCVDRSAEMVVSLLAILKAGGAYLPLDPAYPPDRLAFMLQDAGASLVVCDDAHSGLVSDHPLVCLQADAEIIRQYPQSSPDVTVDAENLAYVIYTSGSTGRPKGVMIRHSSACNLVTALIDAFAITANSRVLQFASLSFDAAVTEVFCTLKAGARLIVPPPRTHLVGSTLAEQIINRTISVLVIPPSVLATLDLKLGINLTTLGVAGEASLPSLLKPWCDGRRIINAYGPTEATVCVSWYSVNATEQTSVPIGYPIWNTQLYVLDGGLEPVPVGVSGELYIGGVGLARGYLGRPDLTAERFVPDPFGSAGGRLYRTGDRVYRRADGALEFLGRYDHQVKLRGYRIETGEIEAALTSHPSVGQAAVLLRADGPGEGRLVAYVVGDASAGDLRAHLQQTLPDYMVPAAFVTLSALPLTPNGKLDRKALPEPDDSGLVRKAYIAPRTPVEEMLTSIWAEVLGVTQVGVEDNFFDLGGDSILALQVISRAKQRGLGLQVRDIFANQSVTDLSKVIKTPHLGSDEQGPIIGDSELTPIQHWFMNLKLETPTHWNQGLLLRLNRPIDFNLLAEALAVVFTHHDVLRSRFVHRGDSWRQEFSPPDTRPYLEMVDLTPLSAEERSTHITQKATEVQTGFCLTQGPLLKGVFFAESTGSGQLLLIAHHLVVDGVSWRVLIEDLSTAYLAMERNQLVELPPKTSSWLNWTNRLFAYADKLDNEIPYWKEQPWERAIPLPVDHAGDNLEGTAKTIRKKLDRHTTAQLVHKIPRVGATIETLLLASLAQTLTEATGQPMALIELEGHGREELFEDLDISRTVGWFTTTYPILIDLSNITSAEVLKRTQESLDAVPCRGIGYGLLREIKSDLREIPTPQVSLNYLGHFDQTFSNSNLFEPTKGSIGANRGADNQRPHLLDITARVINNCLSVDWTYNPTLHNKEYIERLAETFLDKIKKISNECSEAQEIVHLTKQSKVNITDVKSIVSRFK
ncbi:non-ribosomal peptide synthetase [Pseudovibrio sp. Tun.PSC04-5.I4]|uniref:non-ribosomal peptide synthetase n=1 Tax=Pseudovibrio sp. Tun.PSC04-5.I4 TaxID=1798213 RepID=UPI0008927104|nr:non-ribosomal peptide synthetase [Pseudovibrio sp. Tun.PSC04-5.I4]SDR46994.1 non-ribosomal peptide synthase domain TIGR01720/amino acid adenylation domain-containing protein [Pseudovibrio sp. Tun.PSC04-5.I4]